MKKKLSDYLRLYTGCKVFIDSGAFKITGGTGCLIGCTESRTLVNFKDELLPIEAVDIKPILRSLSNITDDEKKEIFRLIFGKDPIPETAILHGRDWALRSGIDSIGMDLSGSIWAHSDLQPFEFNQHEITRHLLKWGFDLFDLINSGLAIDVTKIGTIRLN
jgi:hypothetical protein